MALIPHVFSQKFRIIRPLNDVLVDSGRFSELEITIDEIWQVRKVKPNILLIILEPLLPVFILHILKISSSVGQEVPADLRKTPNLPVS